MNLIKSQKQDVYGRASSSSEDDSKGDEPWPMELLYMPLDNNTLHNSIYIGEEEDVDHNNINQLRDLNHWGREVAAHDCGEEYGTLMCNREGKASGDERGRDIAAGHLGQWGSQGGPDWAAGQGGHDG